MRAREFVRENASAGASCAGNVASVAHPMGGLIKREGITKPAKYANSVTSTVKRKK